MKRTPLKVKENSRLAKRIPLRVKENRCFMKRTRLIRHTPLKQYVSLRDSTLQKVLESTGTLRNIPVCSGIHRVSRHQARVNYQWSKTVKICKVRCGGICEVRGPECLLTYGITPHHVVPRARGGSHSVFNTIMGCAGCHDHGKYPDGTPFEIPYLLELVKRLNEEHGIEAG